MVQVLLALVVSTRYCLFILF